MTELSIIALVISHRPEQHVLFLVQWVEDVTKRIGSLADLRWIYILVVTLWVITITHPVGLDSSLETVEINMWNWELINAETETAETEINIIYTFINLLYLTMTHLSVHRFIHSSIYQVIHSSINQLMEWLNWLTDSCNDLSILSTIY